MSVELKKLLLKKELEKNKGILRLAPCWVARKNMIPGGRMKLDPRDLYPMGRDKGGIDERWFSSVTPADNGADTIKNEGLSSIVIEDGCQTKEILLKEAIEIMGDQILGANTMERYGGLVSFAKFYDNRGPIPHHVHLNDEKAAVVGLRGKPEAYYFPRQLNFTLGDFPFTFFGLEPGTKKEEIIECLQKWENKEDNEILKFSKAYKLTLDTGWDVPPGILHAPGSLLTYEPQRASDTGLFFQSLVQNNYISRDSLVKDIPKGKEYDYKYLIDILDWEGNIDPNFKGKHYHEPLPVYGVDEMKAEGYIEKWIAYGSPYFSAKELTIFPGKTVTIRDGASYGLIMIQGYGKMNNVEIETPSIIRYGQLTSDEMLVTKEAANEGITIKNCSSYDYIVMLKHFGPDNLDAAKFL